MDAAVGDVSVGSRHNAEKLVLQVWTNSKFTRVILFTPNFEYLIEYLDDISLYD